MEPYDGPDGRPISMRALEEGAIRNALRHARGSIGATSSCLGIGRSTLYRKLREFGIDPLSFRIPDAPAAIQQPAPTVRLPPGTFGSPEANRALAEIMAREGIGSRIADARRSG